MLKSYGRWTLIYSSILPSTASPDFFLDYEYAMSKSFSEKKIIALTSLLWNLMIDVISWCTISLYRARKAIWFPQKHQSDIMHEVMLSRSLAYYLEVWYIIWLLNISDLTSKPCLVLPIVPKMIHIEFCYPSKL